MEERQAKRQEFLNDLLDATEAPRPREGEELPRARFATHGPIPRIILSLFCVEGVGDIPLPLCPTDEARLRGVLEQAPHGHGSRTLVDTAVRSAWQVDASKITFPECPRFLPDIQALAIQAVKELEGDDEVEVDVEAHLYKLLLYEKGGHFKMHRDTEKEPGMFGTLLVHLPTRTGHRGGAINIHEESSSPFVKGESVRFASDDASSLRFYYTAFYSDCLHSLEEVGGGTRLVLSFNLVRKDDSSRTIVPKVLHSSMFKNVETVLRPWLEAVESRNAEHFPTKLAIPLRHRYTSANLRFSRLKGIDKDLFRVLANCLKQRLDLHLCLYTKHKTGVPRDHNGFCRKFRRQWSATETTGSFFDMWQEDEEDVATSCWVDVDGNKLPIFPWFLEEVVKRSNDEVELFPAKHPDEVQYEGWLGNEGPTLEYFYHRAMMVVWPKSKTVPIILAERRPNNLTFALNVPDDAEVLALLDFVQRLHKARDLHTRLALSQVLAHCKSNCERIWGTKREPHYAGDDEFLQMVGTSYFDKCVSSRLLDVCLMAGELSDAQAVLELHTGRSSHKIPSCIGVRTASFAKSLASAVHAHGWEVIGEFVMVLLTRDSSIVEESVRYMELALELQVLGLPNEAFIVADEVFKRVSASMAGTNCSSEFVKVFVKLITLMSKEHLQELGSKFLEWLGPAPLAFTWRQPLAQLPQHPRVEAFLRGPSESFTYEHLGGLPEARKIAKLFDGQYKNGYCATAREGGRGVTAYVVITKTREGFQHVLKTLEKQQEDVRELRRLLQEYSGEDTQANGVEAKKPRLN